MKDKPKDKNKLYYSILAVVAIILVIVGVLLLNNNNFAEKDDKELAVEEVNDLSAGTRVY